MYNQLKKIEAQNCAVVKAWFGDSFIYKKIFFFIHVAFFDVSKGKLASARLSGLILCPLVICELKLNSNCSTDKD